MFLGIFYIALLAYKQSHDGINLKVFLRDILLLGSTNMAIAGRAWIIMTLLPYFIVYFWQQNQQGIKMFSRQSRPLFVILIGAAATFAVLGSIRGGETEENAQYLEKFLYYTDGSRITNYIMQKYPDGSFDYEYGRCQFLQKWFGSPMWEKYQRSISNDIMMQVTVCSTMPFLYFDFGVQGGIVMWGVLCFLVESMATKLRQRSSIASIFLFLIVVRFFFAAPIGSCVSSVLPMLQWLIIIYLLRKQLFPRDLLHNQS